MAVTRRHRTLGAAAITCALVTGLSACASDGGATDPGRLLVWSLDAQPDRMAKAKEIAAGYTEQTGVQVDLVGIDEAQFAQLIAGAAQTDRLPDVVGSLPLGLTRQLDANDILDRDAATALVAKLDRTTFEPSALALTGEGGKQLSVPSDAWAQVLVYRTDLFEKRGLRPPTTYADLEAAAKALTTGKQYGITLSTDPADAFTQQTFEALALGNGCELVDGSGEVRIDSPQCLETFRLYDDLATTYSPDGKQDVDTTRASYFSGQSAMVLWSTYLLDELGGLRDDAAPTCPECKADPTWLAKHSGIVTSVRGPSGSADSKGFGEVASWALTKGPKSAQASGFVEHMMSTGYEPWLGIAPEGKVPMRKGPTPGSTAYSEAWASLPAGVDTKAPLSTIYDPQDMKTLATTASDLGRWAIPQGQGKVIGPVSAELPIAKTIAELAAGSLDPAGAAAESAAAVREITSGMK